MSARPPGIWVFYYLKNLHAGNKVYVTLATGHYVDNIIVYAHLVGS